MMTTRERLADERASITRRFKLPCAACPCCGHEWEGGELRMYATLGHYPDGRPGELFIHADKAGSLLRTLLDAVSMAISVALQHGAPIRLITSKLRHTNCPPNGLTGDPQFRSCSSVLDLIAQWLESAQ